MHVRREFLGHDLLALREDDAGVRVRRRGRGKRDAERVHGVEDRLHGLYDVGEDDAFEEVALFGRVAASID